MVAAIAAALGWKPPRALSAAARAAASGMPVTGDALPGEPAPVFSLDALREKNRRRALEIARRSVQESAAR